MTPHPASTTTCGASLISCRIPMGRAPHDHQRHVQDSRCCVQAHHGVIRLNDTAHRKPFKTALTGGRCRASLAQFSTFYFNNLIWKDLLSGLPLFWMAVMSRCWSVQPGFKKYLDTAGDNGLGRSRGDFGTQIHRVTDGSSLPLHIILSPGQTYERQFAQYPLDGCWS